MGKKIKEFYKSVSSYTHHFFLATKTHHTQWKPKFITDRFQNTEQKISDILKKFPDFTYKLNALDISPQSETVELNKLKIDEGDLLIFPNQVLYRNSQVQQRLSLQPYLDGLVRGESNQEAIRFNGLDVFVCCHSQRDERCALHGQQLLDYLQQLQREGKLQISESSLKALTHSPSDSLLFEQELPIRVWPTSHVGGHAFAGNLLAFPPGDWYGHIACNCSTPTPPSSTFSAASPSSSSPDFIDISTLLKSLLTGQVYKPNWRGRMSH